MNKIKEMKSTIRDLKDIVDALQEENNNLWEEFTEASKHVAELDDENKNLQKLITKNAMLMIQMIGMLRHCQNTNKPEKAFRKAIAAYMEALAENLLDVKKRKDS